MHLNFSPVVIHEGWQEAYDALFQQHEVNLRWHPQAEELLWRPELQEAKVSQGGGANVRYRTGMKGRLVEEFLRLLARRMPYCRVRYAF